MKDQNLSLSQVKNVLVVRLDKIGDILLTTPFLRELRKNLPGAWITFVITAETYELVANCPYINEVLVYNCTAGRRWGKIIQNIYALSFALFHLRKRRFDLAIIPRWDVDYYNATVLVYLSGAKKRIAYSEYINAKKHKLNKGYDKLLTHPITDKRLRHEVERNLEVIKFLGGKVEDDDLELWLDAEDNSFAKSTLEKGSIDADYLLIGIGPTAREKKRVWPKERFLELIDWFLRGMKSKIIFFGEEKERFLGDYIKSSLKEDFAQRVINKMGETTLCQAAALLRLCRLYIGNDTGIMHIAAAMGVPVLEISCWPKSGNKFSAKSPYRFRPWKVIQRVINPDTPLSPCQEECVNSEAHCILQIPVEKVKDAVRKLLCIKELLHPDDQRTN